MSNDKDFKVKNGIQPTAYHEAVGNVVSGSVGYSLAGASYDSKSFSVASQDAGPRAIAFKSDGTKLYYAGTNNDTIYQYSLSTAWDVSTASYDSVSFSVASQGQPTGLVFKSDGTKFYLSENNTSSVYQYSLSTAWDMSTASYDSVSFSVASQGLYPHDVVFKSDGSSMYIYTSSDETMYQYTLSTAWDLSTSAYASKSYAFANAEDTSPEGMDISADGTKFYMVGRSTDSVYQYTLSTAWDISTTSYDSISLNISSQDTNPYNIVFGNSGQKLYAAGQASNTIYQYSTVAYTASLDLSTGSVFEITPTSDLQVTLSNPAASGTSSGATLLLGNSATTSYDIAGAVYDSVSFSVAAQATSIQQIYFKPDGLTAYSIHASTDTVYQYTLSTAWDVSTGTYANKSFSVTAQENEPVGMHFKPDGTKLYITGFTGLSVYQYSLSIAWDLSTASYDSVSFSVAGQDTPRNIFFKPDGTKFYVVGHTSDNVYQYSLSTAWDLSTASYDSVSFNVFAESSTPTGIFFIPDGTKMYVVGYTNDNVNEYNLSTAWDVSTASYSNTSFNVLAQDTTPVTVFFGDNGTKMYVGGQLNNTIYQYSTATPATITYPSTLQWSDGTAPTAPAIGETDVLTFNTTDGGITYKSALAIDGAS